MLMTATNVSEFWVIGAACIYLLFLFGIAWWGDRQARAGKKWVKSPWIYTLSLAVYCTAWTFFGSVGEASRSGMSFLAIYIGPSIVVPLAWIIWRRFIRICKTQRITSFAEFFSARYGRSSRIGVLVTLFMVLGVIPYISIQHKAISESFEVLTQWEGGMQSHPESILKDSAFYFALLLTLFTIVFSTRKLESTERNVGLVVAVAVESVVKLFAFLLVGVIVTFFFFDGFGSLFEEALSNPDLERLTHIDTGEGYGEWFFLVFLSMGAFLFLPRQFQVGVIENENEQHLKKAIWLFPLYLLLINLFVLPVAIGGNLLFPEGNVPGDIYMLAIPLQQGEPTVALISFIGGFAASTSMIIVSSIALGLALSNNILMPLIVSALGERSERLAKASQYSRRISIGVIILLAYLFYRLVAAPYSLVQIGLISFVAVSQFIPASLGALFWKEGNRKGAVIGLISGFCIWFFTLIVPTLVQAEILPQSILEEGLFGWEWLRPQAMLGLEGLSLIAHGTFWSLLVNTACYVGFSLFTGQKSVERNQAEVFVDIFHYAEYYESSIARKGVASVEDIRELLLKFHEPAYVERALDIFGRKYKIDWATYSQADARLITFVEKLLTGIVGATSARVLVSKVVKEEKVSMDDVLSILKESQALLLTNKELKQKSEELKKATEALQVANERLKQQDVLKDEFLYTVTHELRTPLTTILALSEMLMDIDEMEPGEREKFLSTIVVESERMGRLITQVLDLEKYESGKQSLDLSWVDMVALTEEVAFEISPQVNSRDIALVVDLQRSAPPVEADADRIKQVLLNLLGNAVKFARQPGGKIELSLYYLEGNLKVNVKDDGEGLAPSELESVFDKFYQVRKGTQTHKPGSGLGLAICKQIVELHGGQLWVESELGKGAKFSFLIPVSQHARSTEDQSIDR